ncbi:MAG TPA: hypothetical protein VMN03_13680 [Burkholderiales bacterium]|nr:hypothetical protein [Burkholderiales bacterium]
MTLHSSEIAAVELRVTQSRRELRANLHQLRSGLTRPSFLGTVVAASALLGYVLWRRGAGGAIAGALASAVIRFGANQLPPRASTPKAAPPTPAA